MNEYVNLHHILQNRTSIYLLPSIEPILHMTKPILARMGLINVYIDWIQCPDRRDGLLYLLMNPSESILDSEWDHFRNMYSAEKCFEREYHLDTNVIVLTFRINPKFRHLKECFIAGKYSKFGPEYIQLYRADTLPHRVMTKNARYREHLGKMLGVDMDESMELDSIPNMELEVLDYSINKNDANSRESGDIPKE